MPGDIHSMKHWKLSEMPTPESPPVIFQAKPCARTGRKKPQNRINVKYWEIIADKLSKSGWSLGWVSAVDFEGRTIWIVDAHRDNGKRFVVRSDEELLAFLELERITHELAVSALLGDDSH
jgi:hypothetical protein